MAILTKNSKSEILNSKQIPNPKQIPLFNHLTNYHLIDFRCYLGFGPSSICHSVWRMADWNLGFYV